MFSADKALEPPAPKSEATNKAETFQQPKTLAELLALPPAQLEKVDIAVLNLLCAEGLRGSDELDMKLLLGRLDALAVHVERETKRNQHLFDEHPEKFKNSLAYFRMAMVATVLVQDVRIQYNPEREMLAVTSRTSRTSQPIGVEIPEQFGSGFGSTHEERL